MTLTPSVIDAERLLKLARAARLQRSPAAAPIEPVERGGALPLSFAQQRLWFLEQLGGLGDTYHIPTRLRLGGELDRPALRRALDAMLARHEALRTTFVEVEGEPVQRIAPVEESRFHLLEHDLGGHPDAVAELHRLAAEEAGAPFDLEHGPLIRGRLVRMAGDQHVLLLTMHHIVSDGWSMGVLTRELTTLYTAFRRGEANPLPPLPIQYADYAIWQRKWVDGEVLRQQAEYWKTTLAGAPELLELPTDRPRPARQDHAGGLVGIDLGEALTAELKALGRRHGTTLFMTALAGWATVLSRLSGQHDVVVGTPSANRGREEIEGLIGFFINTLALRVDLSGSPTVAELLEQVRTRSLGAQQNQDIPFEQVVELVQPTRSMAHAALFQVMLSWQNASEGGVELPGLRMGGVGSAGAASKVAAKFDLSLALWEAGGRIVGSMVYATALFERATIERHLVYLRRALEAFAADDRQAVDTLPLLPESERRLVLEEWNRTEPELPRDTCVHELFQAQVRRTPHAAALSWRGERLTYAELAARGNRIANALRRRGVGPEMRVGICLPRTPELVAAMLGVLGAGGAYVPLDPAYPRERLGFMLEDAAITLVITESTLADRLPEGAATLLLDRDRDAIAAESADAPESGVGPENLSHVIFTSGSTGRPKGVMICHSAVSVLLHWMRDTIADEERASVLFSTSVNFDVSVAELFGALCWGGTLVMVENALELPTVADQQIRYVSMVPTAAAELLRTGGIPASVRTVNLAGEALPNELAQGLYALGTVEKVRNLYGPTEDTSYSTYSLVARGGEQVLIGTPLANSQAYVLDGQLQPVPLGAAGELYLAGDGLARGYANRPAITAERFLPCPFGAPGGRMYRTMDRVRRRADADGELEYLGRTDFQVKVRGFRIELGEIESRLVEHPQVHASVVLAREDTPGDTRLVAYVAADETVSVDVLRAHLAERLPAYMVPAAYVRLDALPQTPNGKVDRKALPAPEGGAFVTHGYEAPAGQTEEALAGIWAEVLGVERVGRHDNFFELGGHSLLAVRVISRVRQVLGLEVGIADLFEKPVLSILAQHVHGLLPQLDSDDSDGSGGPVHRDPRARAMTLTPSVIDAERLLKLARAARLPRSPAAAPIEPMERGGTVALSFAQQRLWFLEQLGELGSTYHIPTRLRFGGELDRAALRRALDAMLARHESLRTTFVEAEGEPVQRIATAEESSFHLVEHDLGGHPHAAAELRRLAAEEADAPFDLERGPLIRGRLVRVAGDQHVLLLTMHHIVSDGWSMEVLTRELTTLYTAFRRGEANPLPPLPIQYADYALWQRKWVTGEVLRQQAEYWKTTLAGAPELLELPTDHPRPARQDHAGATLEIDLGEELTAGLKALGQRRGTTLFMTLLAGWAAVLGRLSGQRDVVVGTPSANRGRAEIAGLIGFFVNTLALRVDLSGSPAVAELLEQVRARSLGAQQNQDIPFEQVVELVQPARSLAHTPLFQVMFAWLGASDGRPEPAGPGPGDAGSAGAALPATAKFDLSLALGEAGGRIVGSLTWATSLFEQATIERHLAYLRRVLEAFVADDLQAVDRLALLSEEERRRVVEDWNRTEAGYPRELCIHELFEAQVERAPDAPAVVCGGEALTYAALNARANRLAHHLRALGVGPDARVAICVHRGVEMMAGLLAIMKAGGAYVPLDPAYPVERLRHMLADSAPAVLLTQGSLAGLFDGTDVRLIDLVADAGTWAGEPETNPARPDIGLTPDHLAYVIYTSGSTGQPKGVMVEHRSLANL
ncbi:MAG TPA: amino acid adenylation domain-containing protein, partial [Longimicrobium sp.]|nr:amino acid adenylation domain-containing protein [Longimicrobium sp.]